MALFVVLIVLLLTSLLVVVSLRSSMTQERMVAGTRDRAMALQNAEAALVHAQNVLEATPSDQVIGVDCRPGVANSSGALRACAAHPTAFGLMNTLPWQELQDGTAPNRGSPAYVIQYLGPRQVKSELGLQNDPNYGAPSNAKIVQYYRVLARGNAPGAGANRTQVLLQATLIRE